MKNLLTLIMTSALSLALAICAGCQKKQTAEEKKAQANIIQLSLTSDVSTLDPAQSFDQVSARVVYQLYEPLFQYHYLKRPYTLEPLLAESMPTYENNNLRYLIKIKKNVLYHPHRCLKDPQRTVKAEDFITQIKRLAYLPTKSNGWWLFDDKIKGLNEFRQKAGSNFQAFQSLSVEGLKALNEHTLMIDLKAPYPQLLYALSMSHTAPIPMEAVACLNNDLREDDLGTGPFQLKEWLPQLSVELSRFPQYRQEFYPEDGDRLAHEKNLLKDGGKKIPFLDGVKFSIMKESQTRWLNFLSGKIDILDSIPKDNFASAVDEKGQLSKELQQKKMELLMAPSLTYWWLAFNMRDPILGKNKNLRQAIAHAINVEEYINLFTHNVGLKANSLYPPGIPGYDPAQKLPSTFNRQLALDYLKKAGYPQGKGLPTLTYDVRGNDTTQRQQAEFIKKQLQAIGIPVTISLNTFPAFLQKAQNGNLQFWLGGWALDYPDAENVVSLLLRKNFPPGPNASYYSHPHIESLYQRLQTLDDSLPMQTQEKAQIMKEIETIFFNDLPWVMLFVSRNYVIHHHKVKNFRPSELIANSIKYLKINEVN